METIETTIGSNGTKKNQLKSSRIEAGRRIDQTTFRHRQNINNLTFTQLNQAYQKHKVSSINWRGCYVPIQQKKLSKQEKGQINSSD